MISWILRRIVQSTLVVLAMTIIVFVGVNVIGNPVDILISPDADQIERTRAIAALGLDKPLWEQYLSFLNGVLHGDFGKSFVFSEPALQVIMQRMPATLELAVCALLLSVLIGIPGGGVCRPSAELTCLKVDYGRLYPWFFPSDVLGRFVTYYGLFCPTWLAANLRTWRDSGIAGFRMVVSNARRAVPPRPASLKLGLV